MEITDKMKKIAKRIAAFVILWVVFTVVMMIILFLKGENSITNMFKCILLGEILGLAVAGIFYLTIKMLFDWIKDDE